jgi:hypothetical protein
MAMFGFGRVLLFLPILGTVWRARAAFHLLSEPRQRSLGIDGKPGVISVKVAALTEGVLKSMLLTKLKIATAVLLAVATAVVGSGGLLYSTQAAEPRKDQKAAADRKSDQEKPEVTTRGGRILVWRDTKYVLVTPEGKEVGEIPGHPDKLILNEPVLSPDGKRVVFTFNENPPADKDGNPQKALFVRDVDGKTPGFKIAINALNASWSPDGKQLLVAEFLPAKDPKDIAIPAWLVDIGTKEKTSIDLPNLTRVFQFTPDGKSFVAAVYDLEARKVHLALISRDGKKITKLTSTRTENPGPKLSPDGTKILFLDDDPAEKLEKDMPHLARLFIYDIGAKKRERLADTALNSLILGHCWSPNGKQVAYTWKVVHPGVPLALNTENMDDPKLKTETESHLVIADADGRNAKVVISAKANSGPAITIGNLDWR